MPLSHLLKQLDFNERPLTIEDFDYICDELNILVAEKQMKWKGLYTVVNRINCIGINEDLSKAEKAIVSFHELGHYALLIAHKRGVRLGAP